MGIKKEIGKSWKRSEPEVRLLLALLALGMIGFFSIMLFVGVSEAVNTVIKIRNNANQAYAVDFRGKCPVERREIVRQKAARGE